VLVYTVNEASEARRLFALGVSGVFTDFPGRLRAALREAS
jgi:glycerophosphoryl diester phosphodiesterase